MIREIGTHIELMESDGQYREITQAQTQYAALVDQIDSC